MIDIKLPFWLNDENVLAIKNAATGFWQKIQNHVDWQLTQADPLTCNEQILDLIAWEKDVTRLPSETLSMYRNRVNFAFINAQDAGSVAGMFAIFDRLGIDIETMYERHYVQDWDVITIEVTEQQLSTNNDLFNQIIQQYGRTCRRYEFVTVSNLNVNLAVCEFAGSQEFTEVQYVQ